MTDPTQTLNPSDRESYRMYYQHQYDRMTQLEEQRMTMTNVIVSVSVISFSLAYEKLDNLNFMNAIVLPAAVVVANVIAVLYHRRSRSFIKMHQGRAHLVLGVLAPELESEIDKKLGKPHESDSDLFRRERLQNYLHATMILAALVPILTFGRNLAGSTSGTIEVSKPTATISATSTVSPPLQTITP